MAKRMKRVVAGVVMLVALALGGAVFAQAQSTGQSAPKAAAEGTEQPAAEAPEATGSKEPAAEAPEATGSEQEGAESATDNDGPGGHADEPGNPGADHEAQGQE